MAFDFDTCARLGVLLVMFVLAMVLFGPGDHED